MIALFFLLILSISSAYADPPHDIVALHNDNVSSKLLDSACLSRAKAAYDNPVVCAEIILLTAYPSVDYRISAANRTRLLWRYAFDADSAEKITTDSHGCKSYFHKTFNYADVYANITAVFLNRSYFTNMSTDQNNLSANPFPNPVPELELNKTQGDNLTFSFTGTIVFHYSFDRTISAYTCDSNGSCSCTETVFPSEPLDIFRTNTTNLTYEVEGGRILHFLSKPVLHEQWAADSVFEDLVFSKREFYFAHISIGNQTLGNASLYGFNVSNVTNYPNNTLDGWEITSYPVRTFFRLSIREIPGKTDPKTIQPTNENYTYIYIFNSTYSALGPHNITIIFKDEFGNNFSQSFNITNRKLTFNNSTGEDKSAYIWNSSIYRPSLAYQEQNISLLIAGFGGVGALVLVLLIFRK